MSSDADEQRPEVQALLQRYLLFYSQRRWDEWLEIWADDGVLEFPFAPAGRKRRYVGKAEILAYMQATAERMAERLKIEGMDSFQVRPMLDPQWVCLEMSIKGRVTETDAPYNQSYISLVEIKHGKLSLYREYWNPLVSMDASGGREAWTAAFGSPELEGAA